MNQTIRSNLRKLHVNMKVKWEEQFPSTYGKKKFNGQNQRNIDLALKELQQFSLHDIRREADKMKLMYYISQNEHDNKWGLDKNNTPEGGGVIAQSSTFVKCVLRAKNEFGIHPIFIYGVGLDGF